MGAPQYEQAGADIGGSGTTNTIPRWTGASTLGDSVISESQSSGAAFHAFTLQNTQAQAAREYFDVYAVYSGALNTIMSRIEMGRDNATPGNYASMIAFSTRANGGALLERMRIDPSGNVGIGTASPAARVHSVAADGTYQLALAGTTKGIRFQTTAAQSQIDGVDSTLVGSYQPLAINGSTLGFLIGGVTKAGINGSSQLYVSTNGTAASPVICESTGVSGMYFPTAATVAIAANGAIAATFSKVAGAGVALGGTTGLVFDASGNQQGIKLRATPDSADTQTLDAYAEGTYTPTTTGFGGTVSSATGAYTRIGRMVFCEVLLNGTAMTASYGTSIVSAPFTIAAGCASTVQGQSPIGYGIGATSPSSTQLYVPTMASASTMRFTCTYFV